ncbi:MAG: class I tRNA ligase family protein, partial [Tenericutes bacterium]|nr:class I tRNA ligase family protein [Mycoplasmatota bacterium]
PNESGWIQDEDVLDTWFSSALWPFSTLGWPKETADYKRYYPNSCLVTGYDIIPFWVNRMTFQALHFTNQRPFENCLIHGLIRDKTGRKMSKSLGNGIDPMDVIEKYGADALRYFLTTNSSPGMDLRYDEEKLKATWNFINKLWNAARFVLLTVDNYQKEDYQIKDLTLSDKWILTKLNETIKNVTKSMDQYDFHIVGNNLYSFIWNDFCDWYIELSKNNPSNTTKNILLEVLIAILKMLHPFMPYVTEEIYNMLPNKSEKSIMITKYPIYDKNDLFKEETQLMELVIKDIVAIRNLKLINKIPKNASVDYAIKENVKDIFINLLKIANNIPIKDNNIKIKYESSLINITYYFEGQMENLIAKENEIKKLQLSIKRREALLNNPNYVNKAPIKIVELDQQKLKEEQKKLKILLKEE